jgi:enoyl-CoA hydratase/carnithine racemase
VRRSILGGAADGYSKWAKQLRPIRFSGVLTSVAWRIITLNRPQVYNAYNGDMIAALLAAFDKLSHEPLRVALITGSGRNFQAGADINWLDAVRRSSPQDNLRASRMAAEAIQRLKRWCKAPVSVAAFRATLRTAVDRPRLASRSCRIPRTRQAFR